MPGLFDNPTCKLPISADEIADVRSRIPRWLIDRYGEGAMIDAEFLRREFRAQFGGCTVLNSDRFLSVGERLQQKYSALQIYQAILAYGSECKTNAFRLANPGARLSMESFISSKRFDVYVAQGEQLLADRELRKMEPTLRAMPAADQAVLFADALRSLDRGGTYKGQRTLTNPVVRREALRLLLEFKNRKSAEGKP